MSEAIKGFRGIYGFLSNFLDVKIEYNGLVFNSVEAAYQAQKTLSPTIREKFIGIGPTFAKKLGRQYPLRSDWEFVKLDIMYDLIRIKFKNPILRQWLLDTGDAYIEETNDWKDTYWGVCKGVGQNHLGKILMEIRSEIKAKLA